MIYFLKVVLCFIFMIVILDLLDMYKIEKLRNVYMFINYVNFNVVIFMIYLMNYLIFK